MSTSLHTNGPWSVENGLMVNKYGACTNNPAVCIDKTTGSVLKCGDDDMIRKYSATAIDSYIKCGFTDMANSICIITFDRYGTLNIDEICTLMNYMQNSIGPDKMNTLLNMNPVEIKAEIKRLQSIDF